MNNLTLTYDGTTKTLDAWGLTNPIMVYRSRAASSFTVTLFGGDPAAAAIIPYAGQVIIKDGDTVIFVGKRRDLNGSARGNGRDVQMVFKDAWDSLERITYQMQWTTSSGTELSPRCFLNQNLGNSTTPWSYWQTKDQIIDVINFAHTECGLAIQAGTIDPITYLPVFACRAPKCSDVINMELEPLPSACTSFDYTAVDGDGNPLPKLHIRQRINCTPVTLPWADSDKHLSSEIKSREDLQAAQVVFQYQETATIDGTIESSFGTDAYPIGSTGTAENAMVAAIDLRGSSRSIMTGVVVATAFDPTNVDFWTGKDNTLADANITGLGIVDTAINGGVGHPQGITIVDHTGANIDITTYPHEMKPGQIAPWMLDPANTPLKVIEAIVTAHINYSKHYPGTTNTSDVVTNHPIQTRIHLTNSPAGTVTYSAQASGATPESAPANLAYLLWCDVNNVAVNLVGGVVTPPETAPDITGPSNLQWEGTHRIIEETISTYYTPLNTLNLSGGAATWEEMNAQIYEVEYDFFHGITTIQFGAHKHLTQQQFYTQAMQFQVRISWDNPNVRNTGFDPAGAGVQLGKETRIQDTVSTAQPARWLRSFASCIFITHREKNFTA